MIIGMDTEAPGNSLQGRTPGVDLLDTPPEDAGAYAAEIAFNAFDLSPEEARQRFRWARKQGHATWLWPDVAIDAWRDALLQIENCIRQILAGSTTATLIGDAPPIGLACYTSGIGPLLGYWVRQGRLSVPSPLGGLLDLHFQHNAIRTARLQAVTLALLGDLTRRGIDVVVLKGAHTGNVYFPTPATRPASDIDLLVRPADAPAAEAVLRASGLAECSRALRESSWAPATMPREPRSLMLSHADDPWSIDLHVSLDLPVNSTAVAALNRGAPMESEQPWPLLPAAKVLPQPLLLLHLAIHASAGLQNLSLLRLVELHLVIVRDLASERLSWHSFLSLGTRVEALGYAYPAMRLCEDLAPGTVPLDVIDRCRQAAPPRVAAVLSRLRPATVQRIERNSLSEYLMWSRGWAGAARQILGDIAPITPSWRAFWSVYEKRWWRIIRGAISR